MRKINLNTFVYRFVEEVREFEENQTTIHIGAEKSMEEWVESFLVFSGHTEKDEEDIFSEEYDDDLYYGQDLQFQDLVNRRKYRSFRDDDSY